MKKTIGTVLAFFLFISGCSSTAKKDENNPEETKIPEPMEVEEETEIDISEGEEATGF